MRKLSVIKKKPIPILLLIMMLVSAAGCSFEGNPPESEKVENTQSQGLNTNVPDMRQ